MNENGIATKVVDTCCKVHVALGPGLLESVHEEVLAYGIQKRGLMVNHQQNLPVFYDGPTMKMGFRLDLIVNNEVIIELKSVDALAPVHAK